MSIEAPRIVIIEDNSQAALMAKDILEYLGFVVTVVDNMQTALAEIVPRLIELGVTHVLLDANLTPKDTSGNDGRFLAAAIKKASAFC